MCPFAIEDYSGEDTFLLLTLIFIYSNKTTVDLCPLSFFGALLLSNQMKGKIYYDKKGC